MSDGPSVAVIGLDIMGSRMARQLGLHGFHVRGSDPGADRLAFSRLRQSSKNARLVVEQALSLGAPADLVEVVAAALPEGGAEDGELDNSAIVEVVRRRAGIGRAP